jgi:hypothetical protein
MLKPDYMHDSISYNLCSENTHEGLPVLHRVTESPT